MARQLSDVNRPRTAGNAAKPTLAMKNRTAARGTKLTVAFDILINAVSLQQPFDHGCPTERTNRSLCDRVEHHAAHQVAMN